MYIYKSIYIIYFKFLNVFFVRVKDFMINKIEDLFNFDCTNNRSCELIFPITVLLFAIILFIKTTSPQQRAQNIAGDFLRFLFQKISFIISRI